MSGKITVYAFIFVGFSAFVAGLYFIYDTNEYLARAARVDAEVVEVEALRSTSGVGAEKRTTIVHRPTFAFRDGLGRDVIASSRGTSSGHNFPIGSNVSIYYDRDDPTDIRIDETFFVWGFAAIFTGLGALFFGLGVLFLRLGMARPKT